jgi:hypothetical protein
MSAIFLPGSSRVPNPFLYHFGSKNVCFLHDSAGFFRASPFCFQIVPGFVCENLISRRCLPALPDTLYGRACTRIRPGSRLHLRYTHRARHSSQRAKTSSVKSCFFKGLPVERFFVDCCDRLWENLEATESRRWPEPQAVTIIFGPCRY